MYEDGLHAEGAGYGAGVLAARAPKTGQHVLRGIVTLGLGRSREVGGVFFNLYSKLKNLKTRLIFNNTCVRALIGRHMASFATRMKPMATSSTLIALAVSCDLLSPFAIACKMKDNKNKEKHRNNLTLRLLVG